MKKFIYEEKGDLILELSLTLPIFLLVIMFVYGFFVVYTAENQITHALMQASKSLSLDSYLGEKVVSATDLGTADQGREFWRDLSDATIDMVRGARNDYFLETSDWYLRSDNRTVEKRFIGFFAGGDETAAAEKLEALGIEDGLKFTVTSSAEELNIKVDYTIQIWFDFFEMGKIKRQHEISAKMW